MSTDYTGDPAGAVSPDAAPQPENFPISRLPSDGDALNAASIQQAIKAPDNHIAWLKKPIARVSQWGENLRTYRDALARRRFKVDHFAMPHGALYEWVEQWTPLATYELAGVLSNSEKGRWNVDLSTVNTLTSSFAPGIVANQNKSDTSRALRILLDDAASGNKALFRLHSNNHTSLFTANSIVRLTMDFTPLTIISGVEWRLGFIMGGGQPIDSITNGVYFLRPTGAGTNWTCRTVNGGGPTDTDSGISGTADARHVFEIYLVGSSMSDDSTMRALFFIDGVLKGNHTANLPTTTTTNQAAPAFGGFMTASGGGAPRALMGQVKYAQITDSVTF